MMRTLFGAALLALPLAACGPSESQNAAVISQPSPAAGYANTMRAMPEGQRNATLYRAIADAGRDCQQVNQSQEIAPVQGNPTWTATCDTGVTWVVVLNPNGIATVTNAAELQAGQKSGG